jgi:phytanoyl-CoA hydroxylase
MIACEAKASLATDGYEVVPGIFSELEIESFRDAIEETIDRTARALRAPLELSHPAEPLEDRLEKTARQDRVYSLALYQAVLADAHRDKRLTALESHPRLREVIREAMEPYVPNGVTLRVRADIPTFPAKRRDWHQDVVHPAETGCGSLRIACWFPLTDVDEQTGALEVIPGRWEEPLLHEKEGCGSSYLPEDRLSGMRRVSLPARRGDVILMDRFLPHRGIPVQHGRCRWAIAMWVKGMRGESQS